MASERDPRCDCLWCGLDRLFRFLKSIGINNCAELSERMKAAMAGAEILKRGEE